MTIDQGWELQTHWKSIFRSEEVLKNALSFTKDALQFDHTNRLIWWNAPKEPKLLMSFDDVLDAYLEVDEVTTSGKSASSVLGRAAVLGVLTGGFGAVVGAMTAKSVARREVKSVKLVIEMKAEKGWKLTQQLQHHGSLKGYGGDEAIRIGERLIKRLLTPAPIAPAPAASPDSVQAPDARLTTGVAAQSLPVGAAESQAADGQVRSARAKPIGLLQRASQETFGMRPNDLEVLAAGLAGDGVISLSELDAIRAALAKVKPNAEGHLSESSSAVCAVNRPGFCRHL